MAPGQSELAPKNELFTQVSLLRFLGAHVFLTLWKVEGTLARDSPGRERNGL